MRPCGPASDSSKRHLHFLVRRSEDQSTFKDDTRRLSQAARSSCPGSRSDTICKRPPSFAQGVFLLERHGFWIPSNGFADSGMTGRFGDPNPTLSNESRLTLAERAGEIGCCPARVHEV
ncbi:hypothetical protein CHELA1G11_11794 [Hyphomicrobiales bacterium]|nr:hypothetical protein CHELA1G11_11794 [Hyphomicrobiales bacterium]CAH1665368.1 hypothetical protein CHELA1G2_12513 [Hyphomicrobiales bacterium]